MRFLVASLLVAAATPASATCRLRGAPYVETQHGQRKLDLRLGARERVFAAAPVWLDGKSVVLSDSGLRGRVPYASCPDAKVSWRRVEALMLHTNTPAPNPDIAVYANAVVFGPNHGRWIGHDRIEQLDTPLVESGPSITIADARPSPAIGTSDRGARAPLGVMRLAATVSIGGDTRSSAGDLEQAFRYTVRDGDGFLGWLSTFFNVPYLFGSSGKGTRAQAEQYYGADCADVLVAALRRSGVKIEYTSVSGLVDELTRIGAPVELQPCTEEVKSGCGPSTLRWGKDLIPGDLLALDYVGSEALPRPWDHIVAAVEDRGDGVLGPDDLVIDSGSGEGLKLTELAHQGHVRIQVLRPKGPVQGR